MMVITFFKIYRINIFRDEEALRPPNNHEMAKRD